VRAVSSLPMDAVTGIVVTHLAARVASHRSGGVTSSEMAHEHDHSHAGHSHAPSAAADRRWLRVALALIAGFMGVEIVAGLLAGSLALLSDAAHMLTDAASIGVALVAARLAARPAAGAFTFGLGRAEIVSAQINGAALFLLAGAIAIEAVRRLGSPPDVEGAVVVAVGVAGAIVNVGAFWALSRSERRSLNIEGARAHVLADLYGSVAAIAAGAIIASGGPMAVDAVAALTVAALMLRSGWSLLHDSTRVLLEAAPRGIDPHEVGHALAAQVGIVEIHDLHVWEVTSGFPALAAHVIVAPDDDCHGRRRELQALLRERFGIEHTTLQVDHVSWQGLVDIEPPAQSN
jgi:cobalt-zinc-cadmium efflux system protein